MLDEIKKLDSGLSYDKYKNITEEQIDWLIGQAEIVQTIKDEIKGKWTTEPIYVSRLYNIINPK